jgi:3D (Asp-Asp-Asp) domain-containing protein/LysM repeat protein
MKKLIGSFVAGIMIAGTAATTVSAGEYEVEKGDSLWKIANENDSTVEELVELNDLNSTTIHPNQLLLIKNKEKYTVEQGDTLNAIANNYDATVSDLKDWNDLSTDLIVIGQELQIQNANVNQDNSSAESNTNETTEAVEETNTSNESSSNNEASADSEGETFTVTATAYTADCDGCSGITSTGVDLNNNPDAKVIAVDPDVIPLGSEVYVEGYGYATAADVGSAIQGNKIDIHVPTKDEAFDWGVRTVDVTIVE